MKQAQVDRQSEKKKIADEAANKYLVIRKQEVKRLAEEVPAAVRNSVVPDALDPWHKMLHHGDISSDDD